MKMFWTLMITGFSLFIFTVDSQAQLPEYDWAFTYSAGGVASGAKTVVPISNCQLLMAGTTAYGDIFTYYYYGYAAKLDENGDTLWTKRYGGAQNDQFYSAIEMAAENYVFAGMTNSSGAGGYDFWWVKTNTNGDTVRTKRYGGVSDDVCYSIIETVYQYQVLAGYTYTGGRGGQDFYVVKVHSNGDTLWTRAFGGQYSDVCQRVLETADRGYLLIGSTSSFGVTPGGNADAWIVRISENGDSLWSKTFGGTPGDYLRDAVLLDDGSLVVCGLRYSETTVTQEGFLIKVSADGDSLWGKTYDGAQHDVLNAVDVTGDGGFILAGTTNSFSSISRNWLLKTNENGDSLWSVFYGDTTVVGNNFLNDVQVTPDYGFVIAGESLVFINYSINVFKFSYFHPGITSITDVGNDQGRQVRARWHGVSYDALCGGDPTITGYSLYRRIDAYLVDNPVRTPRENLDWPPGEWEYVATVPARGEETYAAIVPTLADSSSEGIYWSTFFVSAETANPLVYYDSAIDSGYSVDNLVPDEAAITAALEFVGGDVIVRWEEVSTGGGGQPEQGEIWYRVYGGTNPNFVPGAGTLLTTTQALSYSHPMTEDIFFFKVLVSDDH